MLSGTYSIRINDQFLIVFNFDRGEASSVAITDYH
jgi:plasmid maintenance system killer protein